MGVHSIGWRLGSAVAFALALSGCASVAKTCGQYSASAYEDCAARVRQANEAKLAALRQLGSDMQAVQPAPEPTAGVKPTAFLKSQYEQGQSKICVYDRLGSPYVITIDRVQLCPLTTQ